MLFWASTRNRDDEILFLDPTLIFPVLSFCSSKMWGMTSWKIDLWSQKYYFKQPKQDQFKDVVIVTYGTFINYSISCHLSPLPSPSRPLALNRHPYMNNLLENFCLDWWRSLARSFISSSQCMAKCLIKHIRWHTCSYYFTDSITRQRMFKSNLRVFVWILIKPD